MRLTVRAMVASLALLALPAAGAVGVAPVVQRADPGPPARHRYALLIGVSSYPDSGLDLRGGPRNDVALIRDLLVRHFGFSPADVLTLVDSAASRSGVVGAARSHLGQASADDLALLYFSGHGVQLPHSAAATDPDTSETDGLDEALLLWGRRTDRLSYLLDDEVGILLDGLAAGRVIIVIDACHAGAATRGILDSALTWAALGPVPPPTLPVADLDPDGQPDARRALWASIRTLVDRPDSLLTSGPRPPNRDHLLLAASREDQIALNGPLRLPDGTRKRVGLFTASLYQEARRLDKGASLATLMSRVRTRVEAIAMLVQPSGQAPVALGPWQDESVESLLGPAVSEEPGR